MGRTDYAVHTWQHRIPMKLLFGQSASWLTPQKPATARPVGQSVFDPADP